MGTFNWMIQTSLVLNLSLAEQKLLEKAIAVRDSAYAPYSGFLVGASVLMHNGDVFSGNNQENAAYPSGICASIGLAAKRGKLSRRNDLPQALGVAI